MADAKPARLGTASRPEKRDTTKEVRWRPGMPEPAKPARRTANRKVNQNKPEERPGEAPLTTTSPSPDGETPTTKPPKRRTDG
ncbi:MAG: hypothetical protein ACYS7Y_32850 [Planctomycetota bacterium]|jgi:hypothetical protein